MQDYASNSDKSKKGEEPPKKDLQKVVVGEVVVKEKSLGSRFKNIFLGGDMHTASNYIVAEVLLPATRNLLVEIVTKGMDRLVYGESGFRPRSRPSSYAPRVQYNNPVNRGVGVTRAYLPDQRPVDRWEQTTKSTLDSVILNSKTDAENVIEQMTNVVDMYEVVSLADLNELIGQSSTHIDHKWGWSNLAALELRQVREGWQLTFPPMEAI